MKITNIECHILLVPDYDTDACSSAQDDLVVEVHTDEGITGIGETDTNPWVARACIQARGTHVMGLGLEEMLIGADPLQPQALWQRLYSGSKMTGRRGALICAMGALDMALWDIRGKALGLPVYQLLGGAAKSHITPYASLLPVGDTLKEYQDSLVARVIEARQRGFSAAKLEVCINGPYAHNRLNEPDEKIVSIVAACREAVGADMVLMLDVAYSWSDAKAALRILKQLQPYDLFFVETPIDIDDLAGYAYLHEHAPVRIAAGEWQNTHFEFLDLADRGQLDVLQPDMGRVGGLSEALKVAQIAADRGRLIVPHCWKSGIGIAATAHFAAATASCPYIEYLPAELSESGLRRELANDGLRMTDGVIALPDQPGLGVTLNREALQKYRVE